MDNYDEYEYDNDEDTNEIDDYNDIENDEGLQEPEDDDEKSKSILSSLTVKNKKMYFDEELVKDLIINKYQPFLEYGINEKGKRVCTSREKASKEVEKEIMANLLLIANAIINKYRYWRFESADDLQAEALKAMWYYLPNYVPGKGSAFDLFSIICKRHLLNFTLKGYKHRITGDIDTCFDVANLNKHFVGKKRKKYIELTAILMEYLVKNNKVVGKNDLLAAFKEYSYKSTEYKKFIDDISSYKEELYEIVK